MKFTDGLFHKVFDEIAKQYPDIQNEHWIVDIGAAKLADTPEVFDVVVMPNLYGDILSDVAAQISGSVGLAGSANIGDLGAMFEAIHGSAPRRAGQNLANPSGLLLAAIMMLVHIDQTETASKIHNAWLRTIEEGIHTYDIYQEGVSKQKVGTKEFAEAIVKNLGKEPHHLHPVNYKKKTAHRIERLEATPTSRTLVGIDLFLFYTSTRELLLKKIQSLNLPHLELKMISNRGARIWPEGHPETFCIDQWRCRFLSKNRHQAVDPKELIQLLDLVSQSGLDIIKTENLYLFDDIPGYSSAEG
jgi:isocitrate dehydrogenase